MRSVGLKVLKHNLSGYIRWAASSEAVLVTDRPRVIGELVLPQEVKYGEPFQAKVVAWSHKETQARLSLFRNGEFLGSQIVRLTAGKNVFAYRQAGFAIVDVLSALFATAGILAARDARLSLAVRQNDREHGRPVLALLGRHLNCRRHQVSAANRLGNCDGNFLFAFVRLGALGQGDREHAVLETRGDLVGASHRRACQQCDARTVRRMPEAAGSSEGARGRRGRNHQITRLLSHDNARRHSSSQAFR